MRLGQSYSVAIRCGITGYLGTSVGVLELNSLRASGYWWMITRTGPMIGSLLFH